ncbi:MAG TPA: hypothetical protein VIV06_01200 [Candidatus Limnocylindrales bacterium]
MNNLDTKPSGPAAAAMIAAGIGTMVLGIFVVLNEASAANTGWNDFLKFDAHYGLGSGVGPLSGKVALAVIAFAVSWVILHFALRKREVNLFGAFAITLILVALGFALTFPPIFDIFAPAG